MYNIYYIIHHINNQIYCIYYSKSNDPLHNLEEYNDNENTNEFNDDDQNINDNNNDYEEKEVKVFTSNDSLGYSTSGRQKWKSRHQKGKFNEKRNKSSRNSLRTPGTFSSLRDKKFTK